MPIDDWTSGLVAHEINGVLDAGASYTLVEIAAPAGYVKASAVTFTVNMDGTVTPVVMEDDTTKVRITKTDITGENEVAGATLTLKDEFGNVVDEWVSTEEAHEINGKLAAGATYTLTETNAPAGYAYATDVVFTVNEDGTVNEVTMSDDVTKVNISKYAQTLDAPLAGAEMLLRDEAGNVVDSWTSTEEAHNITGKLVAGAMYTLVEVAAPQDYAVAEPITFYVEMDGTVQNITMYDLTEEEVRNERKPKVELTKTDINAVALPGATLELRDAQGTLIESWISTTEAHKVNAELKVGDTYTLTEVNAPAGYVTAKPIQFVVSGEGKTEESMVDETTKVNITKYAQTTKKPLAGASLELRDSNGKVVDSWVSDTKAHALDGKLTAGETYTLVEKKAPEGYEVADPVTFTVADTADAQAIAMYDLTTEEVESARKQTTTTTPKTTTTTTTSGGSTVSTSAKAATTTASKTATASAAQTGDSTPIAAAALLMIVALGTIIVVYRKKAKKQ